jgi:hypothetical protein
MRWALALTIEGLQHLELRNGAILGEDVGVLSVTRIVYVAATNVRGSEQDHPLTWVNGSPGVYGSAPRASGAGAVLTWLQGPLTLRIEGAQTLEEALALARSLR